MQPSEQPAATVESERDELEDLLDAKWIHVGRKGLTLCGEPRGGHGGCSGVGLDWLPGMRFCPCCGRGICPDCLALARKEHQL